MNTSFTSEVVTAKTNAIPAIISFPLMERSWITPSSTWPDGTPTSARKSTTPPSSTSQPAQRFHGQDDYLGLY